MPFSRTLVVAGLWAATLSIFVTPARALEPCPFLIRKALLRGSYLPDHLSMSYQDQNMVINYLQNLNRRGLEEVYLPELSALREPEPVDINLNPFADLAFNHLIYASARRPEVRAAAAMAFLSTVVRLPADQIAPRESMISDVFGAWRPGSKDGLMPAHKAILDWLNLAFENIWFGSAVSELTVGETQLLQSVVTELDTHYGEVDWNLELVNHPETRPFVQSYSRFENTLRQLGLLDGERKNILSIRGDVKYRVPAPRPKN